MQALGLGRLSKKLENQSFQKLKVCWMVLGQFGPGQFGPGQFGPGQFGTRTIRIRTIRYQDNSVLGQFGPGQFGPEMTITQKIKIGKI